MKHYLLKELPPDTNITGIALVNVDNENDFVDTTDESGFFFDQRYSENDIKMVNLPYADINGVTTIQVAELKA